MKRLIVLVGALAMGWPAPGTASASTTYHGTLSAGAEACQGVWSPAPAGTVGGTWNLNVKRNGDAEISLTIFRDGRLQANWASVDWTPAPDNDPPDLYHYTAAPFPGLTMEALYVPSTDTFTFEAYFPAACIGNYGADRVHFTGSADRGSPR